MLGASREVLVGGEGLYRFRTSAGDRIWVVITIICKVDYPSVISLCYSKAIVICITSHNFSN